MSSFMSWLWVKIQNHGQESSYLYKHVFVIILLIGAQYIIFWFTLMKNMMVSFSRAYISRGFVGHHAECYLIQYSLKFVSELN